MLNVFLATMWVAACSGYDILQRRVPNGLMGLGWIGALLLRTYSTLTGNGDAVLQSVITVASWALALAFWLAGWWGAADAKFIMALSLAFPDPGMLGSMALANLMVGGLATRVASWKGKNIPAVACLGAGWLAWAAIAVLRGYV
jgi:Flp pilus assembly protein protease CpaA